MARRSQRRSRQTAGERVTYPRDLGGLAHDCSATEEDAPKPFAVSKSGYHRPRHRRLQNISRQILILNNVGKHLPNVVRVDRNVIPFSLWGIEAELIQYPLHDGMQPPRSNILRALIHPEREVR